MAASRISGKDGSVKVGGATQLGVRRWSATPVRDVVDTTGLDSAGWREEKAILKQLRDIRIECQYDTAAGGSPPDVFSVDTVTFELSEGTGGDKYSGTMVPARTPIENAYDGVVTYSVEGNSTGEVTVAAA